MELSQEQVDQLHRQIALLQDKNRQARREVSFMQEKLSSQKMMLDEAIAHSTQLEVQLTEYHS